MNKACNFLNKRIESFFRLILLTLLCMGSIVMLNGCGKKDVHLKDARLLVTDIEAAARDSEVDTNPNQFLSVPTQVNKIDGYYFIVDCYNNQVIYSEDINEPLYSWKVMTKDMNMGHTIASDGVVYLIDDTENNRILVFEKYDGKFIETQLLEDIGRRPHYIIYNEENETFYAWSSLTGEMYLIKRDKESNLTYVSEILKIDELNGVYVRSFTIVGKDIYFVSGNSNIIKARLKDFKIKERYPVAASMAGMVQLTALEDGFIITISTDANGDQSYATVIKVKSLDDLFAGDYEDIYSNFIGGGTPYYITYIDGLYYLTEHRLPGHSVWSFKYSEGQISDVKAVF